MQEFRLKNIIRNGRHCVTNKTKFVVASEGGGMFMFPNITIKVQTIKIGEKMDMGKTYFNFIVHIPLSELRRCF